MQVMSRVLPVADRDVIAKMAATELRAVLQYEDQMYLDNEPSSISGISAV